LELLLEKLSDAKLQEETTKIKLKWGIQFRGNFRIKILLIVYTLSKNFGNKRWKLGNLDLSNSLS
jgi:hypothetical protein